VARSVEVRLIDDIDGGPAQETVTFALDGITYQIDLNARHAGQLRTAMQTYISAARRGGSYRARPAGAQPRGDRTRNQALRQWAQRNGITLRSRGRIPRTIIARYQAEAGH
jgi:hypothetical protein